MINYIISIVIAVHLAIATSNHEVRSPEGGSWAVLVAGSSGFWNYRHQLNCVSFSADVAHAYQVLTKHGIQPERIITMMFNDIVNSFMNPFPGKLFNRPNGPDVYAGIRIDYSNQAVTPANFLNILKGNASGIVGGNGRVLKSGPNDRVFVYFADHGATGLIAFPEDLVGDDILTAKDLNDALVYASEHGMFGQLVFYLEACEAGSMFKSVLDANINVYALTATDDRVSSWATYCDNSFELPCLGDLFSVSWLENSDVIRSLLTESIGAQYELVRKLTTQSPVQHYGNLDIEAEPLAYFQGMTTAEENEKEHFFVNHKAPAQDAIADHSSWPARDVELLHLHSLLQSNSGRRNAREIISIRKRIDEIHEERVAIREVYEALTRSLVPNGEARSSLFTHRDFITHPDCHHSVVHAFDKTCIDLNRSYYALEFVNVLNNLCTTLNGDAARILLAMTTSCARGNLALRARGY